MNAPTLLVGLGGTGGDILKRVAELVTEEERNNISFVVFDTDINELNTIKEESPFINVVQTSTKQTVGEYLNIDTHARDTWFPVNAILNSKTLTEGAGQVRSISRLALETVIRAGKMEGLHEAIKNLYKIEEDKPDQALRVIVVSSLAGGTGSGLVLPVAMYIRNYLATHYRNSANIMRGFFILPEVFFNVIHGQAEQNNLKANAYATLRELDAFLMKGDHTLGERYENSVKMLFPRSESAGYEEYDVRPYDFCFLFDAQNAEGVTLESFEQYKEHAANCIYSMSIGPMNKRSNSSEDNTIRKLARERGRNRYAGAGVSMLVYPFEDIRKFIALQWAKQSVSKEWLTFDNDFREMENENAKRREQGAGVIELNRSEFYANQVEAAAKHGDPFAKALVRACTRYGTDGVTEKGQYWKDYVNSILAKVDEDLERGSSELESKKSKIEDLRSELSKKGETYVELYKEQLAYFNLTKSYVETTAENLAFTMFKPLKSGQYQSDNAFRIEHYLVTPAGDFMHPNAIRYFLERAREMMVKRNRINSEELNDLMEALSQAEAIIFDDDKTPDITESAADFETKKVGKAEQENKTELLSDYLRQIDEYRLVYVKQKVLTKGIKYVASLIDAFEQFFTVFESKVGSIDEEINDIYRKYRDVKGVTTRYVCASRRCMDKMMEKRQYLGGSINIDKDLAKDIYLRVASFAEQDEKPSSNRYFIDLFDEGIIGFFKNAVMKSYGHEVDIDVITALEKEAEFEHRGESDDLTDQLIEQYVRKTINNVRELSCPFIESPLGEQREPIYSCTFNIGLKPKKGDNSAKAQLIQTEMMDKGGVPDEDIPKGMLMFYQSFYGLRANDLSKFAPCEDSITDTRNAGEYHKAYFELIEGIHPEPHLSKEISPHIDRWWHINTKMPDLDDDNQYKNEQRIYAAFFWGLLGDYIYLSSDDENLDKKIYKLDNDSLKMESSQLIVSNGTICDKLYEALDSVAIYPELTKKILERIDIRIEKEIEGRTKEMEETLLYEFLNKFKIEEPVLGTGEKPAKSIFSIPMMMKKSVKHEDYYEENVIDLLRAEINEIENYLKRFYSEKEQRAAMRAILNDQFKQYLEDVSEEKKTNKSVYQETLFFRTCSIIATKFEEMEMDEERRMIIDVVHELRQEQ